MITFVFHTHLPYVLHHGTWPHGSDWLCEAVAECYLPMLKVCDGLVADGIPPNITFDISPILCEQLAHPDFRDLFVGYCKEHSALALSDESEFTAINPSDDRIPVTKFWSQWYTDRLREFEDDYAGDIVGALKRLQKNGSIEVMTCGATHGYLPLLADDRSVKMQVELAVSNYIRHFDRKPTGIWLPECSYRPAYQWRTLLPVSQYSLAHARWGVEEVLQESSLGYFITDQGALQNAKPIGYRTDLGDVVPFEETVGDVRNQLEERSPLDVFELETTPGKPPVRILTRAMTVAMQVWSGKSGYPGDPDYLDFHKKYHSSALRYWRVTDNNADMQYKTTYNPEWAANKTAEHAAHFVSVLETLVKHRISSTNGQCVVCLPFDTELFGHWWFEGPMFLDRVLRGIHASALVAATTAYQAVAATDTHCVLQLPESSWGRNGNHDVWMSKETEWTWEKEYVLEAKVFKLLEGHPSATRDKTAKRILRNLVREMLLAQASDWQFLISTFSAKEYAEMRFHNHHADANTLLAMAEKHFRSEKLDVADETFLTECEARDDVFNAELDALVKNVGESTE
ncbi:MAG: DUF1957 domain-containing protein [Ignavibacteria bacterium]|nr:DUF1957 domain-containing protein [Ignavibacteria bacterium]